MKKLVYLFFGLCTSSLSAQVNMNLGLRAYYPFSGNANDASGNNNNPNFNNAILTTDRFSTNNAAYQFNGIDNYMRIPNSPTLNTTNQISICAWVNIAGFYQGTCHGNNIVMKGDADYLPGNYMLRYDDNGYTNGQNCSNPVVDPAHQNYYGINTPVTPTGYTPFIQTNQWTSVVYTCDGTTAKIYVDCQLKISGPANGITFTNSYDLFLGKMNNPTYPYWFNGVMDEIRIYDRALNTDEVKFYGGCPPIATATSIGGIINNYTPVISFNPCDNKITVEDASSFNIGDTVMIIQMKGAVIDSANSNLFGSVTDYRNAGNYEINYVKSKTGNIIDLKNNVTRQYDLPSGKVQLIRVPYYQNVDVTSTLTCLPWDGSKGGVLVLNASDTVNLQATIDVSGRGFRGGNDPLSTQPTYDCYQNEYYYSVNGNLASEKGEGITSISSAKSYGKGALANGGGGGNSHNSGAGGGGNFGNGGFGGYNFEGSPCNTSVPFDNRGIGGKALSYSNLSNKIFLGAGGGGGHSNAGIFQGNGGNGAGIIIIIANRLQANNWKIIATGSEGTLCGNSGPNCHEGMGGGGAGGTVLMQINNYLDNTTVEVKGGKGADMTASGNLKVGPGGGGGGGMLWLTNASLPTNVILNAAAGSSGVCTAYSNDPWGASTGQPGANLLNLQIPFDNILFQPNIDSVAIKDSIVSCDSFDFKGLAYVNANPIANWQWNFGDGNNASTQNTSHRYAPGSYTVKLVVTDVNGCMDSTTTNVAIGSLPTIRANKTNDIDCSTSQTQLIASGGIQYLWSPATGLNNPGTSSPIATPTTTTQYIVTGKGVGGCMGTDSITVNVFSNVNKGGYLMPSGFTPNNDGLNDCYRVKLWGPVQEIEFSIFNRWGERIFFTRDPAGCWDGRYKGVLQDPGVFVYMINAKTLCEPTVFRKGTFALIR